MQEIRTSGSMSGDGKRSVAAWPKLPRPSSTLPAMPQRALRGLLDAPLEAGHDNPREIGEESLS